MTKNITVAICDDEKYVINALEEILDMYSFHLSEKWDLRIQKYTDPQLLLKSINDINILFLDIEMPQMNGFELSREIRNQKIDTKIIFLTSHDEYMQRAFEVKAFRYLKKPFEFKEIQRAMDSALEEFKEEGILIGKAYVSLDDIYYFEVQGDVVAVITKTDQMVSYSSLHQWEEILHGNFSRPHQSFLVHLMYVAHIDKKDVRIKNGAILPLSHRNQSKFKADYDNYIFRKAHIF